MNARGSTEVIVATIGLSIGALTQNLFTIIVFMAVVTTMAMPPLLRWGLSRVPMSAGERERLEREEIEARGFVPNLERLLLAVDDSPNGRLASRLAGLLAAARGLPITVLPLSLGDKPRLSERQPESSDRTERAEAGARHAVSAATRAQPTEGTPAPVNVIVRKPDAGASDAVAHEAHRGYGLLFAGIKNVRARGGAFHPDLERISSVFDGPAAIVDAQNQHREQPEQSEMNILVPVNGTDVSRRAAEVAIVIARVVNAPITALYVSRSNPRGRQQQGRILRARQRQQTVLKDVVQLADQYGHTVQTAVRAEVTPEEAIISEANRRGSDLIVMGVTRHVGDSLFFGETAASVFEKAAISVVLVSS
jgi:nucleotide-binding universal stress UspA family protein